ncbi:putative toxin-antitoxin system, toxin component [Streptomyces albus]|uniref:Putative toxin-antitoxin system, toxin component n=1 Tax=Streptomyces albus (strain ATCC 21838 / DSM 41398 / FERM P-419 / JCM 4703 / NBRC 107858) TaxID=1081613 RepID=A0A0B5F0K5_STRA4|nr:putative toxin-antitoxin system, toxin component [Streptomyces albus]AOU79436.1 putative toxin-antitoxin system, toxin component [Streptomyces albus]AYN35162.1 DUF397 domain-containing protein [Streptomyces albus]
MNSRLHWFKSSYSDNQGGDCLEVALDWHKSSYSDDQGGDCLEVALDWHKSSHSDNQGGACVEVAACPQTIHLRDSKLGESSPQFAVPAAAWTAFLSFAVAG